MISTSHEICRLIAATIRAKGIKNIICSPGSRNAPLLTAFAAEPELKCHSVIDERVAAFMALGMCSVSQNPVVLICTSGTALLNYAPAVAEAYYQSLPLIVISADRPTQWIDQDDSQTINQCGALSHIVKNSYDVASSTKSDDENLWYANRIINDALITACSRRKGPVHINVRISPPISAVGNFDNTEPRVIEMIDGNGRLSRETISNLAEIACDKKILVVGGFMPPSDTLNRAISKFRSLPNVKLMCETISNLHLSREHYAIDSLLSDISKENLSQLRPDLVITFGGALISRKIKEYLRSISSGKCSHWSVGFNHTTVDCFKMLSTRIETDAAYFFKVLYGAIIKKQKAFRAPEYKKLWDVPIDKALKSHSDFIKQSEWSELKAFSTIFRNMPENVNLFLSNGTSIRYAQLCMERLPHACFCNRGVSGIDGSTSTAIGGAMAYKGETVLITGDMSAAYDLGALAINNIPEPFRMIVINNQGGGIFRFIDATRDLPIREELLCSPPKLPLQKLSEAYNFRFIEVNNEEDLNNAITDFFEKTDSKKKSAYIMQINVPPHNTVLHKYMNRNKL